jgi:hypothetical protein
MRVLVCGSRDWEDREAIFRRLEKLPKDAVVIHGAASRRIGGIERSADMLADESARLLGLEVERFPANWRIGKRAGRERNLQMINSEPDLVLAFQRDQSPGTQHTIGLARKREIPVEIFTGGDKHA